MTTSKLPEWPEAPFTNSMAPSYTKDWADYNRAKADAALARMEALVEYAQHAPSCAIGGIIGGFPAPCTCGVVELLAACARKEAGK